MRITEIDCNVAIFCENLSEIDVLNQKIKEIEEYRDDLTYQEVDLFHTQDSEVYMLVLAHTDGANLLQLKLYKELEIN